MFKSYPELEIAEPTGDLEKMQFSCCLNLSNFSSVSQFFWHPWFALAVLGERCWKMVVVPIFGLWEDRYTTHTIVDLFYANIRAWWHSQCVVECRSLAKLVSPIAFGDQIYPCGHRPCKGKLSFLSLNCIFSLKKIILILSSLLFAPFTYLAVTGELDNTGGLQAAASLYADKLLIFWKLIQRINWWCIPCFNFLMSTLIWFQFFLEGWWILDCAKQPPPSKLPHEFLEHKSD